MTPPLGPSVWVFHSGALGDHVMIWPFVRALARQGTTVTLVAASSHARLCEVEVQRQITGASGCVRGVGVEQPRFTRMWSGECASPEWIVPDVDTIVSFVADDTTEAGRRWFAAARAMFPGAAMVVGGAPQSMNRTMVWLRAGVREWGSVAPRVAPDGPITLFAGAGGEPKRWPVHHWAALADALVGEAPVRLIAGPVEAEKWSRPELAAFQRAGGSLLGHGGENDALADAIRDSRMVIGCDTGPTHLAAQLGLPTLALFGPTDPAVWAPVGPRVRVVSPESPRAMEWLSVDRVREEVRALSADVAKLT